MFIDVTNEAGVGKISLTDEDDLQRFAVRAIGCTPDVFASVLEAHGAGQMLDNDVLVSVDWLRRITVHKPAEWQGRFADMIRYADSRGWLHGDGTAIAAHVENRN